MRKTTVFAVMVMSLALVSCSKSNDSGVLNTFLYFQPHRVLFNVNFSNINTKIYYITMN